MSLKTPQEPGDEFRFVPPLPKPEAPAAPVEQWITIKPGVQQEQNSGRLRTTGGGQ